MKYSLLLLSGLLSGCSVISDLMPQEVVSAEAPSTMSAMPKPPSYFDQKLIKDVNDYAQWLMQDLMADLDVPSNHDTFVVTDIALLDSDLNKTNHFGRQFSEAMIHQVNRAGFSVIDIKNTGFIRFNEHGDVFFQSRDYLELNTSADVTNVITGTMTRHQGGYLINGKIVNLATSALVSSGQIFVPYDVVEAVMKEEMPVQEEVKPGIKLKSYKASE